MWTRLELDHPKPAKNLTKRLMDDADLLLARVLSQLQVDRKRARSPLLAVLIRG